MTALAWSGLRKWMGMAKQINWQEVSLAVSEWLANPDDQDRVRHATRMSMAWFGQQFPGRAVEVRVPPVSAIQILGGTTHRRGTPPAVVEMSPDTWLSLFTGRLNWAEAIHNGLVHASGERSNLGDLFSAFD